MSAEASHWTCESWIAYIFDRPVAQPEWWFGFEGPLPPEPAPAEALAYMTRLCTHADVALAPYPNAQVNQGFWYLIGSGASGLALALNNSAVLLPDWTKCVRSFGPLFATLFAPRCSPHLGHLDEPGADPLNLVCYMWWDIFPLIGQPDIPARADLDAACLEVMRQAPALDNDACQESALHGLGHWQPYYPEQTGQIVADFLARTPHCGQNCRHMRAGRCGARCCSTSRIYPTAKSWPGAGASMKNELVMLVQTLARNPGASPEVIAKTEAQLGISFPADYREFLLFSNGAEGAIGASYLALWSVEEIIPLNEGYGSRQFAPELLLFGGDGGGMGYGFDTRVSPMPVYEVDYVVMRIEEGWFRGRTFTEFLRHMAGVPATTTSPDML